MSLPQVEDMSDFYCVTSWSRLNNHCDGIRLMDIENYCGVVSTAKFVYIKAYDIYSPNIPLKEAMKLDILLVFISGGGAPFTTDHGGPVRLITQQL